MIVKLKDGVMVETKDIQIARVIEIVEGCYNIEITYYDEKKNPKRYLSCDSEEEGNSLVDKLIDAINDSRKVKFR